ncbi:hypothetical protein PIROE2DRAFT_1800 [Piromyces sp. E2]|nr:hypothetical protein PIROE2DRAFT_1800 [Piromyces sp. E2]|eukprot:OUM70118.1 hypothetical protein PIROE2DRAFT_1800 [Piromyces sp. E2]
MANDFNAYAREQQWNITFKVTTFTNDNSTIKSTTDRISIKSLLESKTKHYDIFFYSVSYVASFAQHLMDLRGHISQNTIDLYQSKVFNETSYINGRLPIHRDCTALYYNWVLLNKHNRKVPETWDELYDTAKYIRDEERKLNNTELVPFCGAFDDSDNGSVSIFEFLYSHRKSVDSGYPDLKSKEAEKALEMLKKIKEEFLTDDQFKGGESFVYPNMFNGQALFIKHYFYGPIHPFYKVTIISGVEKGISASLIGGTCMGINNYSDEDKKEAAIKIMKFLLREEEQKKNAMERIAFSGIRELYQNEEVCSAIDTCDLYSRVQLFPFYQFQRPDFTEYSTYFRRHIFEYLFNNKTVSEVLNDVDEMIKVHYLTLNTEDSPIGLIYFILLILFSLLLLTTLFCLYCKSFNQFFHFLPKSQWITILLGFGCLIGYCFMEFGRQSPRKK